MSLFRMKMWWGGLVLLGLSAAFAHNQELAPKGKSIDPATIAAYEKLGGKYYGEKKIYTWSTPKLHAEDGVPGFSFHIFPQVKLPAVAVPFGLDLSSSNVTNSGLKELVGLKNLVSLNLVNTAVTDAGMKELAALKNLRWLDVRNTAATQIGHHRIFFSMI